MIRKLQKATVAALAVCCSLGSSLMVLAQSGSANDPAVVVAIKSINGQLEDIKYIGEKAGFGDQMAMVPMLARGFLGGVDLKKPAGVAVWFDGQQPVVVGMIPVTDIEQLLDQLAGLGVNVDEDGDLYFLETPADDMVIKVSSGYAFVSDTKEALADLPKDPAAILSGVSKEYMLGAKLFVQRIPAELRQLAIDQMQEGFQQAMDELDEMDDEALADVQREANQMQIKQLIDMIETSDAMEMGMGVSAATDKLIFDMAFTGLPGSKMAKQAEISRGKSSRFGNFLVDSAAMSMNGYGAMMDDDKQSTKALLASLKQSAMGELDEDGSMSSDELSLVKGLLGDLFDVLDSTIDGGFVDFGGTMMMDKDGINFVGGVALANPTKFDEMIVKLAGMAKTQNEVAIEVSDATVGGVGFKQMIVTLPEGVDPQAIEMFGEKITLLMGRKDAAAYLAVGNEPGTSFDAIMKNSAANNNEVSAQYNFRVIPMMQFASRSPEVADIVDQVLAGFSSKNDRIRVTQKMIPNGVAMNATADADLIKLLSDLGQMMQGGMMGGADF